MFLASKRLSSGKRINAPSDDAFGTVRSMSMRSIKSAIDQYATNLNTAKGSLGFTESTLGEMTTNVRRAYELAVSGANGATDQIGREAMAAEITQIQSRIVNLANSQGPGGSYLFAGQKTSTKPYVVVGSTLTYNGDTGKMKAEVGPGETITTNVISEPMITDLYNRLESLKSNLVGGQVGAISGTDITNIQASLNAIGFARGDVGASLRNVNELQTQMQRRTDELTTSISDVEDVDITEAMLQYQQANQAYTAALTVASQGFRLSLMDFIKG